MNIVKTVDLTKTYNSGVEVHALSNVNFEMEKGDLVAIIGDSGSGKSTLLHLLAGVDTPTSGDIFIQDKNITKFNKDEMTVFRRRNIGVVYQFFNLIPNINVRKNILLPLLLDNKKVDDEYLKEIAKTVHIPVLRKDFTIDEYQIYEAKLFGASAVLLICSLLDKKTLSKFLDLSNELKLDALVEAHDEEEVHIALECGAKIIGVNNRNLKNFTVDVRNSLKLRVLVPKDVVFVSESGIKTREDTRQLAAYHVNAVLIGETLMRSPDKKTALDLLRP